MTQLEKQFSQKTPAEKVSSLIAKIEDEQLRDNLVKALKEWVDNLDMILKR